MAVATVTPFRLTRLEYDRIEPAFALMERRLEQESNGSDEVRFVDFWREDLRGADGVVYAEDVLIMRINGNDYHYHTPIFNS